MLSKPIGRLLFWVLAALCLSSCRAIWFDPDEGSAVNGAIRSQSVYPDGSPANANKSIGGLDGTSAKATIDSYNRSFTLPSGGAAAGATGGSSAPTGVPTPTP